MDNFNLKKYITESKLSLSNWDGYINDLIANNYDSNQERRQRGVWSMSEYGNHDNYDDADEFRSLSDYLRQRGGEDNYVTGPLNVSLVVKNNGDIQWQVTPN
jgi:hypothetical protein